jgi:hypothetical protein
VTDPLDVFKGIIISVVAAGIFIIGYVSGVSAVEVECKAFGHTKIAANIYECGPAPRQGNTRHE